MEDEVVIRLKDVSKFYRIVKRDPSENSRKPVFRRKEYERHVVFENVNADIRRGEVVGIIGTNGCGKSTFLKIISKILKPDTGRVWTKGKIASILELSMGFHADLSGYDNIFLRSELYGIPRSEVEKNVDDIVRYADLGDYIHNPVRTYSSGMRARLAFSIMIHIDADIYLVDEALSTGDAKFASKASEHLKSLVRAGKTILMVSHSMGVIENTCTRAIWLNNKTIFMDGPSEQVCAEYNRSLFDSFEDILQLAEDGSSSAQYRLACCYRDGDKTEPDRDNYIHWLSEASVRGHTVAMSEYADVLMDDDPVKNRDEACRLYGGAADKGNYEARRKYAALVSDAYEDLPRLVDAYRKMSESEYPVVMYKTGNLLYRTAMNRTAYTMAFDWFRRAYEAGSMDAAYMLGLMYRDGTGVPKSVDDAVKMLAVAAESGHPRAQTTLATIYLDGKIVPYDAAQAFKWYLMSAEGGNARSQYQVAVMYRDGIGVEKDSEKASKWFGSYAGVMMSEFYVDASEMLAKHPVETDLVPQDLLKKAASYGNNTALGDLGRQLKEPQEKFDNATSAAKVLGKGQLALAYCYLKGVGTEVDRNMAFTLFKRAADTGNPQAMYETAMLYKEGVDGEPVEREYRKYLRMAAEFGNSNARLVVSKWDARNAKRSRKKKESEAEPETDDTPEQQ